MDMEGRGATTLHVHIISFSVLYIPGTDCGTDRLSHSCCIPPRPLTSQCPTYGKALALDPAQSPRTLMPQRTTNKLRHAVQDTRLHVPVRHGSQRTPVVGQSYDMLHRIWTPLSAYVVLEHWSCHRHSQHVVVEDSCAQFNLNAGNQACVRATVRKIHRAYDLHIY
jgi:hypothetical protein